MSDQASEFTGQVKSELCDLLGINKIRMSPYHPETNGAIKRVHQTLRRMIAKMDPEKRAKWPSHLGPILITYNATRLMITVTRPTSSCLGVDRDYQSTFYSQPSGGMKIHGLLTSM